MQAGQRVALVGEPPDYRASLAPWPEPVAFVDEVDGQCALVHLFTTDRAILAACLADWRARLATDAVVWVSWPKKVSRVATDVTEDTIRAVALPLGYVDVKVCAVDATWSGLKLVVRKALR